MPRMPTAPPSLALVCHFSCKQIASRWTPARQVNMCSRSRRPAQTACATAAAMEHSAQAQTWRCAHRGALAVKVSAGQREHPHPTAAALLVQEVRSKECGATQAAPGVQCDLTADARVKCHP